MTLYREVPSKFVPVFRHVETNENKSNMFQALVDAVCSGLLKRIK